MALAAHQYRRLQVVILPQMLQTRYGEDKNISAVREGGSDMLSLFLSHEWC